MVLRLNDLAKERRYRAYKKSVETTGRTIEEEKELRLGWVDAIPTELKERYQGRSSYWDFESQKHVDRMSNLMREWVIDESVSQQEVEKRLRLFHCENSPDKREEAVPVGEKTTSFLGAVQSGTTVNNIGTATEEQQRLYQLCTEPPAETLELRTRPRDEDKVLLMILNHEIEVPYPPPFLVQSMDVRELACFTDIFMAIEYPLYAHLAPGQ